MSRCLLILLSLVLLALSATSTAYEPLPSLREQQKIASEWVNLRTNVVIPKLLEEHKVEMWILSMREYNEDPAFWGLTNPTSTFSARRRTLYVFYRSLKTGEYKKYEFIDNTEQVWTDLTAILYETNPASIVLNIDEKGNNFADGLHAGEAEALLKKLPWTYWMRVQRQPLLATQFIATRVEGQLEIYKKIMRIVHQVIREGFSTRVITPGKTTPNDVIWFFRDRIQSLNMTTWFQPSVDIQRYNPSTNLVETHSGNTPFEYGDFIWTDFGTTFLGLNTDTQHNGYILHPTETSAPIGLQRGLTHHSNQIQDILLREIKPRLTGNQILATTLAQMRALNISGTVYCHPIGDYGHAAGTLIGMTNLQDGVPILGDIPVFENMWFSIELQANVDVPEWGGQVVNFRQEEDVYLGGDGGVWWVVGRQSELILVGESSGLGKSGESKIKKGKVSLVKQG
ncbi:hypothetical protein HDU79_009250 [Rhizoclosmatium sp. JEL0117]|nr:hypothetical protein HDU79_009250 [Rhizoclosmatium sp. JEL0117]